MFSKFKAEACEIQCRLCLGRIKLMRNKRGLQLKQSRKDVAELLRTGKQEYARIRVEGVIREQLMLQAYEVLELYMELLTVRAQLVSKTKEIPRDMVEAISSIIYAAERVGDLPELLKLRKMFEIKYGPEYVREATNDATRGKWQVNQNLIRCLLVEAPQPEDKLATLSDIAQEHGVEWDLSAAARDLLPPEAPPSLMAAGPSSNSLASAGALSMMPLPMGPPLQQQPAPMGFGYGAAGSSGGGGPSYADANQAAAAAAHAANQARAAADYAAQFAMHQAGLVAPAAPAAPPSDGWLVQQAQLVAAAALPPPGAAPTPPGSHAPSEAGAGAGANGYPSHGSSGGGGQPSGAYAGQSPEEMQRIQRAYDEALGAPSKQRAPAPTAPAPPFPEQAFPDQSAPDLPRPPSHIAKLASALAPAPGTSAPGSLHLPAPPAGKVQPGAPAPPEDEYEALTKRLEALKRS